jgi:small subunit ribosomal protein S24e
MVNIKILEVKENKLLRRKEVIFSVEHLGNGTPNRLEVKEKLAALQTAKADLTFIKVMKPLFSMPQIKGKAIIYQDEEAAKMEPGYSRIRNLPKDQRVEALKAAKAGKKKKKKGGA